MNTSHSKNHRLGSLNVKNTVIASEQSERGNLLTTENHTLNQGIATPASQVQNDGNSVSGSLKESSANGNEIATPCIRKARNDGWSLWWARIPTLQGLSF